MRCQSGFRAETSHLVLVCLSKYLGATLYSTSIAMVAYISKPIPGLKPGAFGLLHAWLTDSVYTDGYVIPSLDPLTLRNSHRPRDCRPKEIPPVQETPGV